MKKQVLILGATSDVAVATAHEFAQNGYDLLLCARNTSELKLIQSDIEIRYKSNCQIMTLDILDFDSHQSMLDTLELPELTICFIGLLGDQEVAEKDFAMAQKIVATNYLGPMSVLNIIACKYVEKNKGKIIGISSVAGDRGRLSNYTYGSAKAAFSVYLAGLRNRLFHHNIHVMTIKPGFMATKMTEGLNLPPALTLSAQNAGRLIFKFSKTTKNTVYISWKWRYIMLIIKFIPELIFKRLKL